MLAMLYAAVVTAPLELPSVAGLDPCTVVAAQMIDNVDSGKAHAGDFFRFRTINTVMVGKRIVIPARTPGYGVVAVAVQAGRGGQAGALVLEPRYLVLPGGAHLGVVLDHQSSDLDRSGRSGNVPGILGAVPALGAAIGIFNFFHHGQNITVGKGAIFSIFPADGPLTQRCREDPNAD
jgi:hypothetical protein